jgi:hypothetical protein
MVNRPLLLVLALLLAAPVWLVGCGGDGDGLPSASAVAEGLLDELPVIDAEATCEALESSGEYECTVTGKNGTGRPLTYTVACDSASCTVKLDNGSMLTFSVN